MVCLRDSGTDSQVDLGGSGFNKVGALIWENMSSARMKLLPVEDLKCYAHVTFNIAKM